MMTKLDAWGDKHLLIKRTAKRDAFWFRLSHYADHSAIWFVLAVIRFVFIPVWQELLRFFVVMAIESGLTNGPIKWCFKRKRPHEIDGTFEPGKPLPHGMRMPITSSFPSGHATAAMCASVLLVSGVPWAGIVVFPLGLCVAYSRMYTRMHHLSDVLAGLALGLLYGYLATRFIPV